MSTLQSSKPIISRVATSLKFVVLLVLLGLIVVATERPMLLTQSHCWKSAGLRRYNATGQIASHGSAAMAAISRTRA